MDTLETRVLLACLHQDLNRLDDSGIETLTPAQWEQLAMVASYQRVRPLLHKRLHDSGRRQLVPEETWRKLTDQCRNIAITKMRMHADLAQLLTALGGAGIPAILLKGSFLGPMVYQNVALREMNDLDIMVPREQLGAAVALAEAGGHKGVQTFTVELDVRISQHVTRLVKSRGADVEFHWNIAQPNLSTSIPAEPLWQRAQPTQVSGIATMGLSSTDLLLHLCFHSSFQHQFEFGLRPSCDIAHVIAHCGDALDWDDVVATCEAWGWSRGISLALRLSRDLVGADVPADVMARLAPADIEAALPLAAGMLWALPSEIRSFDVALTPFGNPSWRARISAVRKRVFLPKTPIVNAKDLPPRAPWWRRFSGRRLYDLIRNHGYPALKLLSGLDRSMNDLARRRSAIREWMSGGK